MTSSGRSTEPLIASMLLSYHIENIGNKKETVMSTTLTSKGQVTIPKQIRDALNLRPGCAVDFAVNRDGEVVIHKAGAQPSRRPDRARGKA